MKTKHLPFVLIAAFIFIFTLCSLQPHGVFAQSPSLGDPIFREDFGTASVGIGGNGSRYTYTQNGVEMNNIFRNESIDYIHSLFFYTPSNVPPQYDGSDQNWGPRFIDGRIQKGSYSIVTNSSGYRNPYFYRGGDHTTNDGTGYLLLVDAHSTTTLYFDRIIEGLCSGTKFQFSVWVKDVNREGDVPKPKIRLNIFNNDEYQTSPNLATPLVSLTTDDSNFPAKNTWYEIKLEFDMPAGVDVVRLQIVNAVEEFRGNDLAIDDITFRPLGPPISFDTDVSSPVCIGSPVTYKARVLDGNIYSTNFFQLQRRKISESNDPLGNDYQSVGDFKTSTGLAEVSFEVTPLTADDDNYEYRVIVAGDPSTLTNKNCRVASEPIPLRVYRHQPVITFSGGEELCVGQSTALAVNITGDVENDYNYFFSWETSTNGTDWNIIPGQSQATINTDELTQTTYYRVTAFVNDENGCPSTSEIFEVAVNPLPDTPVLNDVVTCVGNDLVIAIEDFLSSDVTYALEKNVGGQWATISGFEFVDGIFSKENAEAAEAGLYRIVVQNENGCQVISNEMTVTIQQPNVITAQPTAPEIFCFGGTAELSVAAVGEGTLSFEWFKFEPTGDISVGTGSTYETPSDLPAGTHRYYVVVDGNGSCGAVTSEEVIVTINAAEAGSIIGNQEVCSGTVPTTIGSVVDGSGIGTITYRWESSTDRQSWNTIAGAVNEIYSAPALSQNMFFRRLAISTMDATQCEAYSNVVAITIDSDCSINSEKTVVDANNDGLAQAGEQLTYAIAINNTYDRDITVNIADQIPAHTVYINNTTGGYYATAANEITWNDVIVPAGARISVSFTVEVVDNLTGISKIQNIAVVTGDEIETPQTPTVDIDTDPSKSFTSSKSADKQSVKAGDELTYTIMVTNTGDVDYEGITVADNIPANTTYKEGSASAGAGLSGNTLSWTVDVPFGESREVTFTVVVDENLTDVTAIRNAAVITGEDPGTPEEPEVETPTDPSKSFTASKAADRQSVKAGDELTYTITVTNTGDVDYEGITVADNIPANTTYKEGSASAGATLSDGTLSWTVDIPFGESREVSFTVIVADNLTGIGSIRNVAKVTGEDPGTPEEPEVETPTDPIKSFTSSKSADKQSVKAGDELTYTITVANTGNVDYEGIVIEDTIPANTTYKEGSASPAATLNGGTLSWTVDVPFGESREVSFTVVVADDLTSVSSIRNVAKVTGDDPEAPEEPEVETPTDPVKSFASSKAADKQSVKAGEELTYTITVTNTGNVDYEGITISDAIPANTTYKEGSANPAATLSGGTLSWTVDVPFGESRGVTFTVFVADDLTGIASIRNVAKVTGDDPETPEVPEVETPTTPGRQFESTKTVVDATGDDNAQAGEELTYRITVKNTGSEDYNGITIEDEIPAHTTYVSGSATSDGEFMNDKLSWTIDVPYGKEVSVAFKVQVIEELDGVDAIRNVATVTGGGPENPEVEHPESPEVPVITGPTASNDNGNTDQGQPITIPVLANDIEGSSPLVPESVRLIDPVTGNKVTTVTITGEGTYTVATDGTVTFTPDAEYVGNSTIKYTVSDGNELESNEGIIAIIVEGVAAEIAPTAVDDQATTQYGQAVTITVLGNDQEGSSPIVPSTVQLIDQSGNRVSVVTIPGEGQYEVNAQGIVTFEPADGFTGSSSVRYEVADENGLISNMAVINVSVSTRPFKIPNVFTPNGDGKNDVFEIVGIEGFDRVEITVVNRWGNEVYRNNNYQNNWDGQGLNEGTYYYVIIMHEGGRQERYAGWVLIKKQ